jgi:hypothetical protein
MEHEVVAFVGSLGSEHASKPHKHLRQQRNVPISYLPLSKIKLEESISAWKLRI